MTKHRSMTKLIEEIEKQGLEGVKIERNCVAFNLWPTDEALTESERFISLMQFADMLFRFGIIKGMRCRYGKTRVWLYPTTSYETYN